MQLELLRMLDAGRLGLALAYAGASVVGGFGAVWVATAVTRRGVVAR
jgi:CrcB protein